MTTERYFILGAGGLGKEIAMAALAAGVRVDGFCDDAESAKGTCINGVPVLGRMEDVAVMYPQARYTCAVGNNTVRPRLVERATAVGWVPLTIIHPAAVVSTDAVVSPGCYVAAGAFVGPNARLDAHVLVNVHASAGHDCTLASHVQLCPGVRVSGNAVIGVGVFLGSNAVVAPGVRMGDWSKLGACSFAMNPVPEGATAIGVPARALPSPPKP